MQRRLAGLRAHDPQRAVTDIDLDAGVAWAGIRGIEHDNFFDALRDELEEGRELYRSRVSPDLYSRTNFYDRAIVDVILKSKGHVKSRIW